MMTKILKIFGVGVLLFSLCTQIFYLLYLIDWVGDSFFTFNQDAFTIVGFLFSTIIMLISLIKNKNIKIFLLGFWPILSVFLLILFGIILDKFFIFPEILFVFLLYIDLLFQLFILNKKVGYIGSVFFLSLISFYVYIHPVYVCERENGITRCGGSEWNWDKKTCEKKLSCEVINIPTEQLKE